MIKPTIGRVVWFWGVNPINEHDQPETALVTYVWSDTMVNLVVFDPNGNARGVTSVTLHQEGNEKPMRRYCEWMPYQIGQAKKHEAETK